MQAQINKLIKEKLPQGAEKRREANSLLNTLDEAGKKALFQAIDEGRLELKDPVHGILEGFMEAGIALFIAFIFYYNSYYFVIFGILINYETFYYIAAAACLWGLFLGFYNKRKDNLENLKAYIEYLKDIKNYVKETQKESK